MTWVVGGRHFACVRCIADVEVTLKYKNRPDEHGGYVQKVHAVSDDIVIAFADGIRLAFAIIDLIKSDFMKSFDKRLLNEPELVAQKLTKFIKHAYRKLNRKNERVEFLIFVKPRAELASYGLWKMVSPKFNRISPPESEPFNMLEIGSGSIASSYREVIKRSSKGFIEIPDENGGLPSIVIPVGKIAMKWLFAEALDYQVAGVSHAMHIMLLYAGGVVLEEMPSLPEGEFPKVATSWVELHEHFKKNKVNIVASGVVA